MATFTPRFNPTVFPVGYDLIVQWLRQNHPVWIPILGRQSTDNSLCHFWCSVTNQGMIRVSANEDGSGSSHEYTEAEWTRICNIMQWAIDTYRNPEFTYWYNNDPHRQEVPRVPNRIWGPNVPAICRSYNEYRLANGETL